MNTCKGCGAEILWVVTPEGKRMPLSRKSKQKRWVYKPLRDVPDNGILIETYLSHFEDCPKAETFRR